MSISGCKLKRKDQIKLLKFFVGEVTARSAADIMGFESNTVILFYRKVRQVINKNLPDMPPNKGSLKRMKVTLEE